MADSLKETNYLEVECKKLSDKLKKICELKGISYYALAKKAEIATSTVYSILNGEAEPRFSTLLELCRVLDIPIKSLFQEEYVTVRLSEDERELLFSYQGLSDKKKFWMHLYLKMLQQYQEES